MADIVLTGSYDGDIIATDYIYPTLANRSSIIPGVTANDELTQDQNGTSAFYYKNNDPEVTNGTSGRDFTTAESGSERVVIVMNESFQIDEKMPNVVADNASVDLVGDKAVKGTLKVANSHSAYAVNEKITNGTLTTVNADTAFTKSDIYDFIIDIMTEYSTLNPEAEAPNYIEVSDKTYGLLLKAPEFINNDNASPVVNGMVGQIAGLSVVKNAAMEKNATWAGTALDLTKYDLILGEASAFAAPTNLNTFRVKDSENFVGSRVQGEVSYGFDVVEPTRILVHKNAV